MSLEAARLAISSYLEKEEQVLAEIPEVASVGLFEVSSSEICKTLASRYAKIAKLIQDALTVRFRVASADVIEKFNQILALMRRNPQSIEELSKLREYLSTVPTIVGMLHGEIRSCIAIHGVLQEFGRYMTNDDTALRWRVFGCPKRVHDLMVQLQIELKAKEVKFHDSMVSEQADFSDHLIVVTDIIDNFWKYADVSNVKEIYENVESVNDRLRQANRQAQTFNSREGLFGKESTDYSLLDARQKEWEPYSTLWTVAYHWQADSKKWMVGDFSEIDAKCCETSVTTGAKALIKVLKAFEEGGENTAHVLEIAREIKSQLDEFTPLLPLIVGLRNEGMRDRHWKQVSDTVGKDIHPSMKDFTLRRLLQLSLVAHTKDLLEIGERSGKELAIEKQLAAMKQAWKEMKFECAEPYRATETFILKGTDEVLLLLDEQIVAMQSMQFSPFNGPFKEEIDEWAAKLFYVSETLDAWVKVQRAWMYLQPIFDSPDILKQLPTEGKKFKIVDRKWRHVLGSTHINPNALNACSQEGLLDTWNIAIQDLDAVQKALPFFFV